MMCCNYEHSVQQKFFRPNIRSLGSLWPTSTDPLNQNASFIYISKRERVRETYLRLTRIYGLASAAQIVFEMYS
jgi:hypothetical protein